MKLDEEMNMKAKHIISLAGVLLASAMLFSCKNPATEIVEFDPTYGLDKSKTEVKKPNPMQYNPNNIVTISSEKSVNMQLFYDAATKEVTGDDGFEVKLRLRRAIDKDLTVKFVPDKSLLSEYEGIQNGFVDFPEGVVSDFSIVIPKGKNEVSQLILLDKKETLTQMPGYLAAFKMELVDAPKDLVVSTAGSKLFLKVNVSDAAKLELSYDDPDGEPMSSGQLTASSDYNNDKAERVVDEDYSVWAQPWWVQNKSKTWLAIDFATTKVNGFTFYTLDKGRKGKTIKTVRVEVSSDNGKTYTDYGVMNVPEGKTMFSLVFTKPMSINKVRFSQFDGYSRDPRDPWIDIFEILVFEDR